jgi:hypothetical protein
METSVSSVRVTATVLMVNNVKLTNALKMMMTTTMILPLLLVQASSLSFQCCSVLSKIFWERRE